MTGRTIPPLGIRTQPQSPAHAGAAGPDMRHRVRVFLDAGLSHRDALRRAMAATAREGGR